MQKEERKWKNSSLTRSFPKRKSARLMLPGEILGVHAILSHESPKAARPTTETNPGIGSVNSTKPIPGFVVLLLSVKTDHFLNKAVRKINTKRSGKSLLFLVF